MRLYLIRHAQSTNNALSLSTTTSEEYERQREYDPVLTEVGYQQAEYVAKHLAESIDSPNEDTPFGITHLYCSPMHRTLLTTKPIADRLHLTPTVWRDIHEVGGLFLTDTDGVETGYPGYTRQEIEDEFGYTVRDDMTDAGWWDAARGSETVAEFLSRAVRVALELRERADTRERIALVSHGAFIDALVKALMNQIPTHPRDLFYAHYNTSITRIDFGGDGGWDTDEFRVHYLNRVEHLPPSLRTW